jgi:cupin-like protein
VQPSPQTRPDPITPAYPGVPRLAAPGKAEFLERFVKTSTPAIFRGLLDRWPAFAKWNLEFFRREHASLDVLTFPVRDGLVQANEERGSANLPRPLGECLDEMSRPSGREGVAVTTWFSGLPPSLADDVRVPGYCADAVYRRSRLWITPKATATPVHQDLDENLFGMLEGAKRFYLCPPTPRAVMYPHSFLSKAPNIGRVNPERPDYESFPRFRDARVVVADIGPGDVLYVPSLWWHYVATTETSIAVNFWWARGWKLPVAWLAFKYRMWRGI